MGFDPRHWSPHRATASGQGTTPGERVTSNVEALLRENDALRREIRRLQQELERARRLRWQQPSAQAPARISAAQVQAWGAALVGQPGWTQLRQAALEALIDALNRNSFPSHLGLQQRLDRLVSGLGSDLFAAVGPRATKKTAAKKTASKTFRNCHSRCGCSWRTCFATKMAERLQKKISRLLQAGYAKNPVIMRSLTGQPGC